MELKDVKLINGTNLFAGVNGKIYYMCKGVLKEKVISVKSDKHPVIVYSHITYPIAKLIWNTFYPEKEVKRISYLDYKDDNPFNTELENLKLGVD